MTNLPRPTRAARAVTTGALALLLAGMSVLPGASTTPAPVPAPAPAAKPSPVKLAALSDDGGGNDPFGGDGGFFEQPIGPSIAEIRAQRAAEQAARRAAHARALAAHRAALAARRAAKAQAAANRRAAQRASAAASAQANWNRTGRPNALVIVRGRHIDLVVNGRQTSRLVRAPGPLTLAGLARFLPPGWLALPGDGSAQLTASIVLTAGTLLDNGPEVHVLNLASGANSNTAAGLWVGRATLNLHGLTVNAVDPPAGTPAATAQRGFLVAGAGGTLNIADATLNNLGAQPPAKPAILPAGSPAPAAPAAPAAPPSGTRIEPGVAFGPGSTGSVVRSTLKGNGIGLKLAGSQNVHLDTVTLALSRSDGLVLRGDRGTTMTGVHSQHNAGNGVLVSGASSNRLISGFDTSGNDRFGLAVVRQNLPQIANVTSANDLGGGVRLTATSNATVTNVSTTDSPVGLLANGGSNHLKLTGVHTQGGLRGIVATGGVSTVEIASAQVNGAARTGISVGATDANLHQLTIAGSTTGLQISGRSARATVTDAHVTGGHTGIRISRGATVVALDQVSTNGVGGTGISTASAGLKISNAHITGGTTGINARAAAAITGSTVSGVNEAVHSGPAVQVTGKQLDLLATSTGVKVDPDGAFLLTDSRVRANVALRGQVNLFGTNTISPPPFNWIGAFGVLFIALAFLLELAHFIRQRRKVRVAFPVPAPSRVPALQSRPVPALEPATEALPIVSPSWSMPVAEPAAEPATEAIPVAARTTAAPAASYGYWSDGAHPDPAAVNRSAPAPASAGYIDATPFAAAAFAAQAWADTKPVGTPSVETPPVERPAVEMPPVESTPVEPAWIETASAEAPPIATGPSHDEVLAGTATVAVTDGAARTGTEVAGEADTEAAAETTVEPVTEPVRPSPRPRSKAWRPSPRPRQRPTPYPRAKPPAAANVSEQPSTEELDTPATAPAAASVSSSPAAASGGTRGNGRPQSEVTAEASAPVDAPNSRPGDTDHGDTEETRAAS
ncbi:MAG TPA: right-handed parallel beta-helix repeat-containing protein [Pseudonocardia sp.]|nr:right-handed parallel beta-helix repeat-containing protein [Pseudonocardia sp.]